MLAAVVRNFKEELSLETVADPACPENGVILEVLACGVCRSDYHGWTVPTRIVFTGRRTIIVHEIPDFELFLCGRLCLSVRGTTNPVSSCLFSDLQNGNFSNSVRVSSDSR